MPEEMTNQTQTQTPQTVMQPSFSENNEPARAAAAPTPEAAAGAGAGAASLMPTETATSDDGIGHSNSSISHNSNESLSDHSHNDAPRVRVIEIGNLELPRMAKLEAAVSKSMNESALVAHDLAEGKLQTVDENAGSSRDAEDADPKATAEAAGKRLTDKNASQASTMRRNEEEAPERRSSQSSQPAESKPRKRTQPRQAARTTRRRILTASHAPKQNRYVRDQKTDVPTVAYVDRLQTSDFSRAFITRRFSIRSNRAQILFEHGYDRIDYSLQILTAVIPGIASDEFADRIHNEVEALFLAFEENIDKTLASTREMLSKRKLAENADKTDYDHPRTYETPVRSPFSIRYLNLIAKYDRLNALSDCLWLNGYMPSRVHSRSSDLWQTRFRQLATDLNNLRMRAMQEARDEANKRVRAGARATQEEAARIVAEREEKIDERKPSSEAGHVNNEAKASTKVGTNASVVPESAGSDGR